MKEKIIKVIKINDNNVEVKKVENELHYLQKEVGGLIECFDIAPYMTIICNEEGKIFNMTPNLSIVTNGRLVEILCGPLIICKYNEDGEFESLKEEEIEEIMSNERIIEDRCYTIKDL